MTDRSVTAAPVSARDGSYVDWPAIAAGATIASAIAFVFTSFGAALGLSFVSPYEGEGSATAAIIATGVWMLWTTVSSFMVGGYIAGRMRRRIDSATGDEVDIRDGIHGLTVWGVGALIGAVIASSAAGTAGRVAESAASAAFTSALGSAGKSVALGAPDYQQLSFAGRTA